MSPTTLSLLEFALLGLVHDHQPCCGYDLRKIFTETPMGSFSDSPGSIYPALCAARKSQAHPGSRGEFFGGQATQGVPSESVGTNRALAAARATDHAKRSGAGMPELALRFAFMESVLGRGGLRPIPAVARQGTGRLHSDLAAPPRGGADDEFALGESGDWRAASWVTSATLSGRAAKSVDSDKLDPHLDQPSL